MPRRIVKNARRRLVKQLLGRTWHCGVHRRLVSALTFCHEQHCEGAGLLAKDERPRSEEMLHWSHPASMKHRTPFHPSHSETSTLSPLEMLLIYGLGNMDSHMLSFEMRWIMIVQILLWKLLCEILTKFESIFSPQATWSTTLLLRSFEINLF